MSIYLASDNLHLTATLEVQPEEGGTYTLALRWRGGTVRADAEYFR